MTGSELELFMRLYNIFCENTVLLKFHLDVTPFFIYSIYFK